MTRSEVARQGGVFALVGVAATGVHLAAALTAREIAGLAPLAANLVGYAAAVSVSYLGNARFTFRRPTRDAAQFARFLSISLAALAVNQGIVYAAVQRAHWPFWMALVVVVLVTPVVSFILSRLWAFRRAQPLRPVAKAAGPVSADQ